MRREDPLRRQPGTRKEILPFRRIGQRLSKPLVQRPAALPPATENVPELSRRRQARTALIGPQHWPILDPGQAPRKCLAARRGRPLHSILLEQIVPFC